MGGVHDVEQVEEQPEIRLPRPLLSPKLEHFCVNLRPWMNLRGDNFQVFHEDHLKFR